VKTVAANTERGGRGGPGGAPRDAEGESRDAAVGAGAWPPVPLRDLCVPRTGVRNPADRPDEKFGYVDISAVDNERKRISNPQTLLGRDAPSRARNIIRARDVIVATTRPNLNAVALVPEDLDDQVCSTGFCVLRTGPRIVPEYLFAFVRSPAFVDPLTELVKGALYPAVNDGQVLALSIPLPPLAEQERIAGRLTEQLATVERARGAAQSRLAAAESLPAAYLREVFEGPGASGWDTHLLGRLCDKLTDGTHRSPKNELPRDQGVPYITSKNVRRFRLDLRNVTYVCQADHDEIFARCDPRQGDVLYTKDGAMLGLAAVNTLDYPFSLLSSVALIRPKPNLLDSAFLVAWLNAPGTYRGIVESQLGAAIQRLILDQIKNFEVPLPPLPDQRRIAAALAARLAGAERLAEGIRAELAAIEALPAALLHEAFGGAPASGDGVGA
jgi:type I restriction enzyme S subunit